jgi:hypothetical protein
LKKLIIIFLLSALTFPFWGTYSYFQFEKSKIREEVDNKMVAGFDKSKLVLMKFTRAKAETDLNWKDTREFEYKGQMYDIVQQTLHGDTIFYTCYRDHKELWLNIEKERQLAKAMGQDPSRKSQSEKLADFLKTVFSRDSFAWFPLSPESSSIKISIFKFQISNFSPTPPSPPPKCV